MDIRSNIAEIRKTIADVCTRCGRNPDEVRLVAVSKTKPAAMINEAAAAGQRIFGENYVQDFLAKADDVSHPVEWHYIGALQSNKVKYLRGRVAMIHSVDRVSLAKEIDKQWQKTGQPVDVLIQVKLGDEATKSGVTADAAEALIRRIATLPMVRVRGLMALPPYFEDPEDVRPCFRQLKQLAGQIDAAGIEGVDMTELSMGMSHDFEIAIEEGATLVRVGTAIFGARQ